MDWQGIATSVIGTLLVMGGAALLTWWRQKRPRLGAIARYWLNMVATLLVIIFVSTGFVPFAKHKPESTLDNIESNMKLWCEKLGFGFVKESARAAGETSTFAYDVTINKEVVRVNHDTQGPEYLNFTSNVQFPPEYEAQIKTFSNDELQDVMDEIGLELGRVQVMSLIGGWPNPSPGQPIAIITAKIAFIPELSEHQFLECLSEMGTANQLAHIAMRVGIRRVLAAREKAR
jgi:hypothetical protein